MDNVTLLVMESEERNQVVSRWILECCGKHPSILDMLDHHTHVRAIRRCYGFIQARQL